MIDSLGTWAYDGAIQKVHREKCSKGQAMKKSKSVDEYIESSDEWREELQSLRKTLTACGVEETVKWGAPCYTHHGKNVVGIGAFKAYCGLWFYQGALLADTAGVLINAQEGKTKALRQWRFQSKKEIKIRLVKQYVREAMDLVEAGKEIKPSRKKKTVTVPPELQAALKNNSKAKTRFDHMSPGCRREYAEYVEEAKREETKQRRIQKILPLIIESKGLNDKYRK